MRPILGAVTASLLALATGPAHAEAPVAAARTAVLEAKLFQFDIDPAPALDYLRDVDAGVIRIDQRAREIVLILEHGGQTQQEPLSPEEIRLPLTSVQRGPCSTTYTAELDTRPVDGPLQVLRVIDYQNVQPGRQPPRRPCPRPFAPTFVAYEIVTSGFGTPVQELFSDFSGGPLLPVRTDPR